MCVQLAKPLGIEPTHSAIAPGLKNAFFYAFPFCQNKRNVKLMPTLLYRAREGRRRCSEGIEEVSHPIHFDHKLSLEDDACSPPFKKFKRCDAQAPSGQNMISQLPTPMEGHLINMRNNLLKERELELERWDCDHSLIFGIRKINNATKKEAKLTSARSFKHFNLHNFRDDLQRQQWSDLLYFENSDQIWAAWKSMFMSVVDKHAPIKTKRVRANNLPWITN